MTGITSKTDIINLAMDFINQQNIVSLDNPANLQEEVSARHYDICRQTFLALHPWNFAAKRAALAREGTPPFGFSDQYSIPIDCLSIRSLGSDLRRPITDYAVEGRSILCNNEGSNLLYLRYTRNEDNVNVFPPGFITTLALRIAQSLAYKFSNKPSVLNMLEGRIREEQNKAISADGKERPPVLVDRNYGAEARRSAGRSGYGSTYESFPY